MRRRLYLLGWIGMLAVVGCGAASPQAAKPADGDGGVNRKMEANKELAAPPDGGERGGGKPGLEQKPIDRKVIYSATVEVVVKSVDDARKEVEALTEAHKGYVAKSDVSGTAGTRRTATWTLKIPSDKFRTFIAGLTDLGSVTKNSSDSQDVTEEYIDLEARIKNLKAEEEILNKFLRETVNNVDGYIKTREQIKGVRLDIERAEGRLKYLATTTALSTISFTAREEAPYTPEAPPTAPTFGDRLGTTFGGSWRGLVTFFEGVVLVLVALLPWSPFLLVGGLIGRVVWKRAAARRRELEEADRREDEARRQAKAEAAKLGPVTA